jgi:hypothetical protein
MGNKPPKRRSDTPNDWPAMLLFVAFAAVVAYGLPDLVDWIMSMVSPIGAQCDN